MTTTATATFTKLRSGDWGVRSSAPLVEGATVIVAKKDGSFSTVTVEKVIWTDGETTWLAAIASGQGQSYDRAARAYMSATAAPRRTRATNARCSNPRDCGDPTCDGSCGY